MFLDFQRCCCMCPPSECVVLFLQTIKARPSPIVFLRHFQHAPASHPSLTCTVSCTCSFFPLMPQRTPCSHPNTHTVLIQSSHFLLAPWKVHAWKRTGAYVRIDICRVGGRVAGRIVVFGCCPTSSDSMVPKEGFFFLSNLLILLGNVLCSEMQIESI